MTMDWLVGFSRKEVTAFEPEMQIWGWFMPYNRAKRVGISLYARAMVATGPEENGSSVAYVCVDTGYISVAVREVVLSILQHDYPELGLGPHNVMLTATHTHAGPCGAADVIAQTSVNYGFSPVVLAAIVDGIVEAIVEAFVQRVPSCLRLGADMLSHDIPIAFNRSLRSFLRNRDGFVDGNATLSQATRRRSVTLVATDQKQKIIGLINWFGVHATCIHAENDALHGDNKGLAAQKMELLMRGTRGTPGFVSLFAQDAAGDVSPNFRWDRTRRKTVGVSDDDLESVEVNAQYHVDAALRGVELALSSPVLRGLVGGRVHHLDMPTAALLPEFTGGRAEARCTPATWGMLMPAGTAEGPGPMRPLLPVIRLWLQWRRLRRRMPLLPGPSDLKPAFLELGLGTEGRFMRVVPTGFGLGIVGAFDPVISYVHAVHKEEPLADEPWLPRIVPVQMLRLGGLVLVGLSGEPTTMSGVRLRRLVQQRLSGGVAQEVVINGYANGYAGYISTPEEYEQQEYEGAYTTFGQWTLAAYQTAVVSLLRRPLALSDEPVEGPMIPVHSYETLMRRRRLGRAGVSGPGAGTELPEPADVSLSRLKRTMLRVSNRVGIH